MLCSTHHTSTAHPQSIFARTCQRTPWPAVKEDSRKSTALMRCVSFSAAMASGGACVTKLATASSMVSLCEELASTLGAALSSVSDQMRDTTMCYS